MKPTLKIIDSRGERKICREHRLAYASKCPRCEAAAAERRRQKEIVDAVLYEVREMRRRIV